MAPADYFFSYSWDSPWQEVEDALSAHTEREIAQGRTAPYYSVDIFGINQHTRAAESSTGAPLCGACASCRADKWEPLCAACDDTDSNECQACAKVGADMHSWETANTAEAKGFERVIEHTRHTLVLMEPWDNPRPPDRVWCLFEGYTTLDKGAPYEVVLGPRQERELQMALVDRFAELQAIVTGIDVQLAEATVERDRVETFEAIKQLPGGFDGLNSEVRQALLRWLVEASEGVLHRTHPYRKSLSEDRVAMAVEEAALGRATFKWLPLWGRELTALVEDWPRLGPWLFLLGCLILSTACYVKGLTNIEVCTGMAT